MKKNYALIILTFFGACWFGFGQVTESFDVNFSGGNVYGNYNINNFNVNNGLSESATRALSGRAVRLRNSSNSNLEYVGSDGNGKDGGVGTISFWYSSWDSSPTAIYNVQISINGGAYMNIGPQISTNSTAYAQWVHALNNSNENIKIRVIRNSGERLIIDDFEITDFAACSPPADPSGNISGTTPSCNSTDLSYSETASGTIEYYWQTSPTGTDTANNAASDLTVTTSGTYYVRAFDTSASCWSDNAVSYPVVINTTPTITVEPTNQAEVIPNAASFSVTTTGLSSPTYQWQLSTDNGTTWVNTTSGTGATTATYSTGATTGSMNGYLYRCIVSNVCGVTNSNSAELTLSNIAPTNVPSVSACFEDDSVSLNWSPSPTPSTTGYVVFAIEGATDPFGSKNDANTYTANSDFSSAVPVTPSSLGRVVYKGTATNAVITGLTENINYSFTIYAYVGETLTGWSNGGTNGSTITNGLAQSDITNLTANELTNQVTLDWDNPVPTSCWDQLIIVANQGPVAFVPSGDGTAYSSADNDNYTTPNQLVYETTANVSTKAVFGLTNGVNYCFKIFIRRGSTWSEGIEICAVPELTYCDSFGNGSDGFLTLIRKVQLNTIDNDSPNTDNDYSDFTSISTDLTLGESYNLNVQVNTDGSFNTTTMAWIDWNQDGDFSGSNEDFELGTAFDNENGPTSNSPLSIQVPSNAALGATRMRVSTIYNLTATTPCQQNFDGEVEDYTINILQPTDAEINIKGNNISIPNGFNSPYGLNNTLCASTNVGSPGGEKAFIVENLGLTSLNLTGIPRVEIIGTHASDFTVTQQPGANIATFANSEFRVQFFPSADGQRDATVQIFNSDANEATYQFDIRGTGNCNVEPISSIWPIGAPFETEITITSSNDLTGAIATLNGVSMPIISTTPTELKVTVPINTISGNLNVLFSTGCSSTNAFNVINNTIGGCETGSGSTTTVNELFISEISDATTGSSSVIEIYNATGSSISLNDYEIWIYNNNNSAPTSTNALAGTLNSGNTHVITIGSTSCDLSASGLQTPNQTFNSIGGINFDLNSSDAIALHKISTSSNVDVFGVIGNESWANGLVAGGDGVNFQRKATSTPLPNLGAFDIDDFDLVDWTDCGDSDYSNFGDFDFSFGLPPTVDILADPIMACTNPIYLTVSATEGLSGGAALAYQWFYLAPGSSNFTAVPDNADFNNVNSSILEILNPLLFDEYQFYCQVREDSVSCFQSSNSVKIRTESVSWNGTWSSAPAYNKNVILSANYDTSSGINGQDSFEACNCLIESAANLIIADGDYVEVDNNLTVDGSLTIKPQGSFVQINNAAIVDGAVSTSDRSKIQVEKLTAPLETNQEYTYWSSPVEGETISNGLAEASTTRRYLFNAQNYRDSTQETNNNNATNPGHDDIDDNGDDWEQILDGTAVMEKGVGYAATHLNIGFFPNSGIQYVFEGPFNNGIINVPIYRNDAEMDDNNWNFIGNPYPSPIALDGADGFLAQNVNIDQTVPDAERIDGAIYLWSHDTDVSGTANGNEPLNYSSSDYAIINGMDAVAGGDGQVPNRFIPSGQGFFVSMSDAATPTSTNGDIESVDVIFNNAMRVRTPGSNGQFFRQNEESLVFNKLRLNLSSTENVFSQILIGYVENASSGYDGMYFDAPKNLAAGSRASIYSIINGIDKKFAIQGRAIEDLSLDEVIPLGLKTAIEEATIYSISIAEIQGNFLTSNPIYIKDNLLNVTHDLTQSDYTFASETGTYDERFEIVFNLNATLDLDNNMMSPNDLSIVELNNGKVRVSVGNEATMRQIEILDLLGRTLHTFDTNTSSEILTISAVSQSTYFARITLSNGQVMVKKAVKRK